MTEHVAATTQNQALKAIVFLTRVVLQQALVGLNAVRAKQARYRPTVLPPEETQPVIAHLYGVSQLVVPLLSWQWHYQLSEGLQLRVKAVAFAPQQWVIRDPKGKESRVTMLPARVAEPLQAQLQTVRHLHQQDLDRGYGSVYLPFALECK